MAGRKEGRNAYILYMELFAVIGIETSHYMAFVKCGVVQDEPFSDS